MKDNDKWYWQDADQKVVGPFDGDVLRQLCSTGVVSGDTMVTKVGTENWMPLARAGILNGEGLEDNHSDPPVINIQCPGCGQGLSATPDQQGMTFQCPSCNGQVVVPTSDVRSQHIVGNLPTTSSQSPNRGNESAPRSLKNRATTKKFLILGGFAMLVCLAMVIHGMSFRHREPARENLGLTPINTTGVYFTYPIIGEPVDNALARKSLSRSDVNPPEGGYSTVIYLGPRGDSGITWDGMLVYVFDERVVGFWYLPGKHATKLKNIQHADSVMQDVMKVYSRLSDIKDVGNKYTDQHGNELTFIAGENGSVFAYSSDHEEKLMAKAGIITIGTVK